MSTLNQPITHFNVIEQIFTQDYGQFVNYLAYRVIFKKTKTVAGLLQCVFQCANIALLDALEQYNLNIIYYINIILYYYILLTTLVNL